MGISVEVIVVKLKFGKDKGNMKCDNCTEKCPQEELAREIANRQMYATDVVIDLQKQLEEYKTLEEQGLLLRLPCKAGDTVYYPWAYDGQCGIASNEVESITIYYNRLPIITVKDWESDMYMPRRFIVEDFGNTVFLTQSEAEQKLKEM